MYSLKITGAINLFASVPDLGSCRHWIKNGIIHRRDDFPAVEYKNGCKKWYKLGKMHRDNDLPAWIDPDGRGYFYEFGARYYIEKHENGTKEYYDYYSGYYRLHKDNCPAVVYANGDFEYWQYGSRHRTDGPAVVIGGKQYFFEYGEFIKCIV